MIHIDVVDMSGRIIKKYDMPALKGLNQFDFDLSSVNNGLYSIRFYANDVLINVSRINKEN
jgi:hypothetical protein